MATLQRLIALLCIVVAHTIAATAQTFLPIISHFAPLTYRMGLQNWTCTQDARGTMYFGNSDGVLTYDGYTWYTAKLPSRGIVRALLADGERI